MPASFKETETFERFNHNVWMLSFSKNQIWSVSEKWGFKTFYASFLKIGYGIYIVNKFSFS